MTESHKRLVMIGAGGHAKVCYDIAKLMNKWDEIIVLDDNYENDYFEVDGPVEDFINYVENSNFFVAIGNNNTREKIKKKIIEKKGQLTTLIHPNTVIAADAKVGIGTIIMAGVVINSSTVIGQGCIINTSVSIDHDNNIGDYVHVSPGANLAGNVKIGKNTWIGIGSTIIQNIKIGKETIIGAGSIVIKNLPDKITAVGVPAKAIKSHK